MTKNDFLNQLKSRLKGFSQKDIEESLAYYSEMIDDRIEDGASEEEAVAAIGTPAQAAEQILAEMPLAKLLKAKLKGGSKLPAWAIVLLVLSSPIWISLIAAAVSIVLSLYAVIWSIVLSLWAVAVSFLLSPLVGLGGFVFVIAQGNLGGALTLLGSGCILGGLGIFLFKPCVYTVKGGWWLSKKLFIAIKYCFIRKEAIQ